MVKTTQVPSPYYEARELLEEENWDIPAGITARYGPLAHVLGGAFFGGLAIFLLVGLATMGLSNTVLIAVVLNSLSGYIQAKPGLQFYYRKRRGEAAAARAAAAVQNLEPVNVEVPEEAAPVMMKIFWALHSLPKDLRWELREVWDSCLLACDVLKHKPRDSKALSALESRHAMVLRVQASHRTLSREEARLAQIDAAASPTHALNAVGDSDLTHAANIAEGLLEARQTIRRLN